ncbi:MAG: hypothetical protein ACRBN8_34425 [Nannocystales bacterium]
MTLPTRLASIWIALALSACFDPADPLILSASQTAGDTGAAASTTEQSTTGEDDSASLSGPESTTSVSTGGPGSSDSGPQSPGGTTDSETSAGETTESTKTQTSTDGSDSSTGSTDSEECVPDCSGVACGQDPLCGLDCPDQCTAAATCAEDQSYCALALGNPDYLGSDAEVVGGIVFGHRVTLPGNTTLKALGVIAGEAGPNVQLAIYSDSDGPQTRMRQSGEFSLEDGANEVSVPDTALTAGDYWIMIHTEDVTSLGRTSGGDNDHEFAYEFINYPGNGADSFPLNLDGDQIVEDYRYNLYIIVEE